jgi:hypothetical protein
LTLEVSELLLQGFNDVVLLSQLHLQFLNLGLFGGGLDLLISGFDVSVESREDFSCCLDLCKLQRASQLVRETLEDQRVVTQAILIIFDTLILLFELMSHVVV